ncbi:baculoviral IAP repeat-containing protein 5-like isoform X1 [Empidonax traillii]|uniref:baculoviral IAP repeat-containing protein 5-like isoform X1 n=1 Tax=Empidonax traillii TaxID=164674 RepID=UPI000FFD4AED|nr:baculoviral IAP repeat-containing protein 5-like isoform X1 [Empidonax traillii]
MAGPAVLPEEWRLYLVSSRVATFRNWPFTEGCACTPERMAAAGFVHCPSENSPDVAQCFFCLKELEGWEPDDDPLEEHKKHSAACGFLSLQKEPANLTLQEFLKLDKMRIIKSIKKEISQKMTEVEDAAKRTRSKIKNLA